MIDSSTLGKALKRLIQAFEDKKNQSFLDSARLFDFLYEKKLLPGKWVGLGLALSGLSFEAAGENSRARKAFEILRKGSESLPIEDVLGSVQLSSSYSSALGAFGTRRIQEFETKAHSIIEIIREQQVHGIIAEDKRSNPDFVGLLGILDLLLRYSETVQRKTQTDLLEFKRILQVFDDALYELNLTDWLSLVARLESRAMEMAIRRSILKIQLTPILEAKLVDNRSLELWPPQQEAIEKGLTTGVNLVYSTPAGTGKTLLSYMLADRCSPDKKTAYLVPTRSLAEEEFRLIRGMIGSAETKVAVSTRERTEDDEHMSGVSVLVATYEKFEALLRKSQLKDSEIQKVIIDEIHYLSDDSRGIPLELGLTRLKELKDKEDPQIVALSGMLKQEDAEELSKWLNAQLVYNPWTPLDLDEIIVLGTKIYHKSGIVEGGGPGVSKDQPVGLQRSSITRTLVRDVVVGGGQCLVVLESRKGAEEIANDLCNYFKQTYFDPDLTAKIQENSSKADRIKRSIRESEPALSASAQRLTEFLSFGVAFHHAGLPKKLRAIVENGVRTGAVRVVVTTTTFEAGVNLPVSHAIFPFPEGRNSRNPMSVNSYRNLAGRAGRVGFDSQGISILIATNENEKQQYEAKYFKSASDPLDSALWQFKKRYPQARYNVQTELLQIVSKHDSVADHQLVDFSTKTWYWNRSTDEDRSELENNVRTEIRKLAMYGFLQRDTTKAQVSITNSGKSANRTMLSPFSVWNLIDKAKLVLKAKVTDEQFDFLILSLVALPHEMDDFDPMIDNLTVTDSSQFVDKIITLNPRIGEVYQREKFCRRYGTLLQQWINSVPTDEILSNCGLDPTSDNALVEEGLSKIAYWILSSLSSLPNYMLQMTSSQRKRIDDLAKYCFVGSSDPMVIDLISKGLDHMGRNTAIKLAQFMSSNQKSQKDLERDDIVQIFHWDPVAVDLMLEELKHSRT